MSEIKQDGFQIQIEGIFGRNRKVKTEYHTYIYGKVGMFFDAIDAEKAVAQFALAIKAKPGKCTYQIRRIDTILQTYTDPDGTTHTYRLTSIKIGTPTPILAQGDVK